MQNIYGFLRYRWAHGGIVYYGAKGKVWSYNTAETNGDKFDWNQVTDFTVDGQGMDATPTDQLLYDFDFAQFYRQLAKAGAAYRARGVMLLRDDYLVLSDEVQDAAVAGTFNWVTLFEPPQIYQLKPGAPVQEKVTSDISNEGPDTGTYSHRQSVFLFRQGRFSDRRRPGGGRGRRHAFRRHGQRRVCLRLAKAGRDHAGSGGLLGQLRLCPAESTGAIPGHADRPGRF